MVIVIGEGKRSNASLSTIIITAIAILIIIGLAFIYYYFAIRPNYNIELNITPTIGNTAKPENEEPPVAAKKPEKPEEKPEEPAEKPKEPPESVTRVIFYTAPLILPEIVKQGSCATVSAAEPYRKDAWQCVAGNEVYDPCFTSAQEKNSVICPMNPLAEGNAFSINLAKPLPSAPEIKNIDDSWAWFVQLKDGTYCSPYIGARPSVTGAEVYYGCRWNTAGEIVVILGKLKKETALWRAQKAVLYKVNSKWAVKSSEEIDIKAVWQ